jgi:hypothetical protein
MHRVRLRVRTVRVACMGVSGVPMSNVRVARVRVTRVAVSDVAELGQPADGHGREAGAAERQAEPIEVHTLNTTCFLASW